MNYPTPGSLGAELYEMGEQEFVDRFGEPLERPQDLTMPLDWSPQDLMGLMAWQILGERLVINAWFPSLKAERPEKLRIFLPVEPDVDIFSRLTALGFPVPDSDPQLVVRSPDRTETWYLPGPPGLEHLRYVAMTVRSFGTELAIESKPCDETLRPALEAEYSEIFPLPGTLYIEGDRRFFEVFGELRMKGLFAIMRVNKNDPDLPKKIERTLEAHLGAQLLPPGSELARSLL